MITPTRRRCARPSGLLFCLILLVISSLGTMRTAYGADGSIQIKVDQVGYLPGAPKLAVVTASATAFEVKRSSDNVTVFTDTLGPATLDADSGDSVQIADFTKLRHRVLTIWTCREWDGAGRF